jgi:hypothetical protein
MSNPKEKAKKLVDKYYQKCADSSHPDDMAKDCALIAVDEILSFIEDDRDGFNWKTYYKEVKQEIEKL